MAQRVLSRPAGYSDAARRKVRCDERTLGAKNLFELIASTPGDEITLKKTDNHWAEGRFVMPAPAAEIGRGPGPIQKIGEQPSGCLRVVAAQPDQGTSLTMG